MQVLLKESIDRVLNLAINHLIEYAYNGKENNDLVDSYNLLLDYIDYNLIDEDNLLKFNRLKEIVTIVTGKNTNHEFDKKEPLDYQYLNLNEKIKILKNDFSGLSNE